MEARSDGLWLEMARELPASRQVVFGALTEPEQLARWWGPDGFTIPSLEIDLQPGGAYRIEMQPPEGEAFFLSGEYREVDPPARLSYTFRWEDPDPEDQETVVTLSLEDLGDSTGLSFSQGPFATERRRALHDGGWTEGFEKLRRLLS